MGKLIGVVTLALWLRAAAPAWAEECRFSRETTPPPTQPEQTTFVMDCTLPLAAEAVWEALRGFPRLAEQGIHPQGIEYARVLDSEAAKREVAARLENLPLERKPDVARLLELPPDPALLYEEYYHVNLFFLWAVRRFISDTSGSAEGNYRLAFDKIEGLSSEAVFQGSFELTEVGGQSRLYYTLTMSTHARLAGEGLLDILQRIVVGGVYIDGYQTYMMERVEGILREAERLAGADGGRGKQ